MITLQSLRTAALLPSLAIAPMYASASTTASQDTARTGVTMSADNIVTAAVVVTKRAREAGDDGDDNSQPFARAGARGRECRTTGKCLPIVPMIPVPTIKQAVGLSGHADILPRAPQGAPGAALKAETGSLGM